MIETLVEECRLDSPEKRLMLGVLLDGMRRYLRNVGRDGNLAAQARREELAWMFSRDPDWPCSFDNICAALELNPDYVRRGIIALARSERAKVVAQKRMR